MKELKEYIEESLKVPYWYDGHIHLFNHIKSIEKPIGMSKMVGFMDLEFDAGKIDVLGAYDSFISSEYNDDVILLATGVTIEDIKAVFEKHREYIKGFGELKCYDTYQDTPVPYKKISFVQSVCRLSRDNGCLPVYVHWDLNDEVDVKKIGKLLSDFPMIPIVLCHSGMNNSNMDFAYMNAIMLQRQYSNLWIDISYSALDHLRNNINQVFQYDLSRVIVGTDLNNKLWGPNHDTQKEVSEILQKFKEFINTTSIDNKANISRLFNLPRKEL